MNNLIKESSTVIPATRLEQLSKFGTSLKVEGSAEYYITRCDEQIEKCKEWIENLKSLKSSFMQKEVEKRKQELEAFCQSLTKEARAYLLSSVQTE